MVSATPSLADVMGELLALEAREQDLRERLNVLQAHSCLHTRVQRLIFRIRKEREALEQLSMGLFGVKPGRS